MFNVGPLELMVLLVMALIVFGPAKLPELMASAGNAIREFQRASRELTEVFQETQQEFSSALDLESTATTVTEPAAEPSANGHATTEVASSVPVAPDVPVTTAPAEYETAAGLVDDAPAPFEIKLGSDQPTAAEPVATEAAPPAKARRPRRPRTTAAAEGSLGAEVEYEAAPPPPEEQAPAIGLDAAAPLPETAVAAAAEPSNGATPVRRRGPRARAKVESTAASTDESA